LHECGYQKSKLPQASLRPFHFLTANPGKPGSVLRAGATVNALELASAVIFDWICLTRWHDCKLG